MKLQLSLTTSLMLTTAVAMANCGNQKVQNNQAATPDAIQQEANDTLEDQPMAPDFELTDINGKQFKLSSLRGKIVVIDFWGSWCGWCVKGMPEMKKYYEKYKGKMEIVGVDCGDTKEQWKAAVDNLSLPWIHVYNPKGAGDITQEYGIQGFPTKFIVGKDGKLITFVIGEDPAFYTTLDEVMEKE